MRRESSFSLRKVIRKTRRLLHTSYKKAYCFYRLECMSEACPTIYMTEKCTITVAIISESKSYFWPIVSVDGSLSVHPAMNWLQFLKWQLQRQRRETQDIWYISDSKIPHVEAMSMSDRVEIGDQAKKEIHRIDIVIEMASIVYWTLNVWQTLYVWWGLCRVVCCCLSSLSYS